MPEPKQPRKHPIYSDEDIELLEEFYKKWKASTPEEKEEIRAELRKLREQAK